MPRRTCAQAKIMRLYPPGKSLARSTSEMLSNIYVHHEKFLQTNGILLGQMRYSPPLKEDSQAELLLGKPSQPLPATSDLLCKMVRLKETFHTQSKEILLEQTY